MEFVDRALARRFEAAEEVPQVLYAQLYQKLRPEIGATVEEICGGHMVFAGLGSPIGRAGAVGLADPVTEADLDRIEAFYRAHQAPAQIDVTPLTDENLLELLKQRGYAMAELNNVLFRKLEGLGDLPPSPVDKVIRAGRPEEAGEFAGIVQRSFFPNGDGPADFDAMLAPLFQFPGVQPFVAELEGKNVACGAGLVIPEHKIVALFGAGTLAEYRDRGLQTAILVRRMREAARVGCEYAVIVTKGGTTSMRNAERLGFRVAYSKPTLIRHWPDTGVKPAPPGP